MLGVDYFSTVVQVAGVNTQVSDVTPLANLTKLTELEISFAKVSDEEFEKLKQALPNCTIYH